MSVEPEPALSSRLTARLLGFAQLLRENGFAVGAGELADAARVLEAQWRRGPQATRAGLRALFARDRAQWQRFDPLFDAFFLGRDRPRSALTRARLGRTRRPPTLLELQADRNASRAAEAVASAGEEAGDAAAALRAVLASPVERTDTPKPDALLDPQECEDVEQLAERLGRRLALRLLRRQRRARKAAVLDLPATIRASVERGGWPFVLIRRRPRLKPLRLAFLLDVSGSMRPWMRLHLRFLRGLARLPWCESYLFHTRLVPVSRALRERDLERAAAALALLAQGIGGGTRIGEALAAFNRFHAARALRGRSCALLVSDGYETGPLAQLAGELGRLRRRARFLLWLDPLARAEADRSAVRALALARDRIDSFAPAGRLADFVALERTLAALRGRRPRGLGGTP